MPIRYDHRGALQTAVLVCSVGWLLTACSVRESVVFAEKGEPRDETILAVVGDVEVTRAQVAERKAAELLKIERQERAILEEGLDELVAERLFAMEARVRGVTVEELLEQEVESKVTEPTAEEVDAFYEARKAQIRQPKEQIAEQIRDYLEAQQSLAANAALVATLKDKHGYELYLEPLRVTIDSEGFPSKGPADASVTIVEFSDFECPYCARINPTLERVVETYGDKVRIVFRQFPLNNIHPNAQKAAEASLCAHEQEKFWQMHDAMFKEQRSLGVEQLKEKAGRLGLDTDAFNECLDSSRYADAVAADLQEGSRAGITGTPAIFINGRFLSGAQPYEEISRLIDSELAASKSSS